MALITSTKYPKEIPHELGNTLEFRLLSKREMREAEEENTRRVFSRMALIRSSMSAEEWDKSQAEARLQRIENPTVADPRDSCEKDVLLKYGIVSWAGPLYDGTPLTDPAGQLDPITYDWAASVVLDMNVRTQGEGNASGTSSPTDSSPTS